MKTLDEALDMISGTKRGDEQVYAEVDKFKATIAELMGSPRVNSIVDDALLDISTDSIDAKVVLWYLLITGLKLGMEMEK